jgi:hypothetical protein
MRASLLAALGVLVLMAGILVVTVPSAEAQNVFATITGPTALAPRQTASYNVTVGGGPEPGPVTYTVEYFLSAQDLTGGTPRQEAPGRVSGNQTVFKADITAPERDQIVTLVVRISAQAGATFVNGSAETTIQIITPILLRATFRNEAPTAALNVTVRFYVDDISVGSQSIARINPSGEETASFSYLPVGLAPGTHRVRVEADVDRDGRIDPARGELVVTDLFVREAEPLSAGWNLIIGIAVFFVAFFVVASLRRRNR